jgi:GNAT superfamily N-acetyltransferase
MDPSAETAGMWHRVYNGVSGIARLARFRPLRNVRPISAGASNTRLASRAPPSRSALEPAPYGMSFEPRNSTIRRAEVRDADIVVRILIASKEASFPDTIEEHDRDVGFWTRRWRDYIIRERLPLALLGDGWVFLAEVEGSPVGYIAYHHTNRLGTDAELQNIYILRKWQNSGIGTHLLGVVAHRLAADGSQSMCVGFDSNSSYKRFYFKHGAMETSPGAPWPIWHDVPGLASNLPRPPAELGLTPHL